MAGRYPRLVRDRNELLSREPRAITMPRAFERRLKMAARRISPAYQKKAGATAPSARFPLNVPPKVKAAAFHQAAAISIKPSLNGSST